MGTSLSSMPDLSTELDGWVERGLITAEQAARIRIDVATRSAEGLHAVLGAPAPGAPVATAPHPRGASVVTEALGYLGGIVIFVAAGLVAGNVWDQFSDGVQIAFVFAIAALMLAAGAFVPQRLGPPAERLRSVLWAASSAAMVGALVLLADLVMGWQNEEGVAFATLVAAAYSGVLWFFHRRLPQHAVVLGLLAAGVGTLASMIEVTEVEGEPSASLLGLAVWGLGLVWALLAWGGFIKTRRAGIWLGSAVAVVGAMTLGELEWEAVLALVTVAGLVAAAVALRDLPLLGLASFGTLVTLPRVVETFFPGELSAAIALLIVGILLVVTAVLTARRSRTPAPSAKSGRDLREGPPRVALALAGVVAVGTGAAIALLATL
jgi:hypothetical protein